MQEALPERLLRSAARQAYRFLRIAAPLLEPVYRRVGLERRARIVTALVRVGWNGTAVPDLAAAQSKIVTGSDPAGKS